MLQWISLGGILLIVVIWIIRKTVRFSRALRDGDTSGCGCGCGGCDKNCQFADKTIGDDGK